jgi:hypothetical protein
MPQSRSSRFSTLSPTRASIASTPWRSCAAHAVEPDAPQPSSDGCKCIDLEPVTDADRRMWRDIETIAGKLEDSWIGLAKPSWSEVSTTSMYRARPVRETFSSCYS